MKRWGYVKGEVRYKDIAEKVYLLTDAKKYMAEVGMAAEGDLKKFKVMGKEFDPAKADAYVNSFAIKKA
jgi:nitrate/nitrite transport system substrate-binding protein